jgi:hypothetical protein
MNFTARFLFISFAIFLNACTLGRNSTSGDSPSPPAPGSGDSGQYFGTGTSAGNPFTATVAYRVAETLCNKNLACGDPLGLGSNPCVPTALGVQDQITQELRVSLPTLHDTGNAEVNGRLTAEERTAQSCMLEIETASCDSFGGDYAVVGPFDPRQFEIPEFTWRSFFTQTTDCDRIYR